MKMRLKDGKTHVLTLSYDDGVYQDIRLIEIMSKYGIKGTFNVNSGYFYNNDFIRKEKDGRLSWKEADELYLSSGNEIAVHGYKHEWISELSDSEALYEVSQDRLVLETHFNTIIRGMAYPFGCYTNKTLDCLKQSGIVYSRTVKSTHGFDFPENWLELHPTCHHNDSELFTLAKSFIENPLRIDRPKMFYLWGHSYEFDRNNNWNVIEEFCEYMGNRDNIWYATNMEIFEYVTAYNNLIKSFDGKKIYNPSSIPVWIYNNYETIKIDPSSTIEL